tara:strand:- start:22843 stop:23163 length:321 start_codon:yes stop_codon:yes gene_type:complete
LGKTTSLNDEFFTDENNFLFGEELSIAADISSFFVQASGFYNIDDQSHIGLVTMFNVLEFDNFRTSQFFTNNATEIAPSCNSIFHASFFANLHSKTDAVYYHGVIF